MTEVHRAVLPTVPPFDLAASLRAIGAFSPCGGEQELRAGSVRKAFALDAGTAVVAEVSAAPGGVRIEVVAGRSLTADERAAAGAAVSRWLSLEDDLRPFLALADDDAASARVLGATAGLHQVRFASLAEATAYFVLTHRTQQQVAAGRKRRLAEAYGPRVTLDGTEWVGFPPLGVLAGLAPADLAPFTGRPQQTEYLAAALRGVHDLGEDFLRAAPYDEAEAALRSIRGVGPFTANAILMRGLGRPDRAMLDVPAFRAVVEAVYGPGTSPRVVQDRYGRFAAWWGYLARTGLDWADPE